MEEDPWYQYLASTCIYTCVHAPLQTQSAYTQMLSRQRHNSIKLSDTYALFSNSLSQCGHCHFLRNHDLSETETPWFSQCQNLLTTIDTPEMMVSLIVIYQILLLFLVSMTGEAKESSFIHILIVNINYHITYYISHSEYIYMTCVQITEWLQIVKEARGSKGVMKRQTWKGIEMYQSL